MNRFAALLDRLAHEPRLDAAQALLADYFRVTSDPDRGLALAAMVGSLQVARVGPSVIRALIAERTDPVLLALAHDYVGDFSETVALMWEGNRRVGVPADPRSRHDPWVGEDADAPQGSPSLSAIISGLSSAPKSEVPRLLAAFLDDLDPTGRWALLKLVTGSLRIGVSARSARAAIAAIGGLEPEAIEAAWHGLAPPYEPLFAWVEGRAPRPESADPAPFRPPMLAHAVEEGELAGLAPADFAAEWKWDGLRVQAVVGHRPDGSRITKLYSHAGEDISAAFSDILERFELDAAIDGELLIVIEGRIQGFEALRRRLDRKSVTPKLVAEYPAAIRAYDLLAEGEEDTRALPFAERRARLEALVARHPRAPLTLSRLIDFEDWAELAVARKNPAAHGAGAEAAAIDGLMLKRLAGPYLPGRPKGHWLEWKRDPRLVDAVLMYAQRGQGKGSSYHADVTFGLWRSGEASEALVPVGKAPLGVTEEELARLDRFVRENTTSRFGPVREVAHGPEVGLVLEVAFEGLRRSTRHKSGVALRSPRIARIRWDKRPGEADRLERLERMLTAG